MHCRENSTIGKRFFLKKKANMLNLGLPLNAVFAFEFCLMKGEKTLSIWKGVVRCPSFE